MLYRTPNVSAALRGQLDKLDAIRLELGSQTASAGPWLGRLRRQLQAATASSSVGIEGFAVSVGDALSLVAGGGTTATDNENRLAFSCYAHAMDHVGIMASDPTFTWLDRVILDLHFDACSFQREKRPGLWRDGPIFVTAPHGGGIAYEGPDGYVPLMGEVIDWLQNGDLETHAAVRAAMAHLHVVSVHPFEDGNGRISRIVQSLVLARDGVLSPEFNSIEEYLGDNTAAYYDVLRTVQGGSYQPERDATPWVELCVAAHLDQAHTRLAQVENAAARWSELENLVKDRRWPERLVIALEQALTGGVDRASYVVESDVSDGTASADFRRLLDAGLVKMAGKGPSTRYLATDELKRVLSRSR